VTDAPIARRSPGLLALLRAGPDPTRRVVRRKQNRRNWVSEDAAALDGTNLRDGVTAKLDD